MQKFDVVTPSIDIIPLRDIPRDQRLEIAKQDLNLVQLWILGDKFLIHGLQNRVMDTFMLNLNTRRIFNARWFQYAYDHTAEDCSLRKFAVDYAIDCCTVFRNRSKNYPQEMLFDLLARYQVLSRNNAFSLNSEDYYVVTPPDPATQTNP